MDTNITLIQAEIRKVKDFYGSLVSDKLAEHIAKTYLGVANMSNEIKATGVLTKKEEALGKSGKPYFKLAFTLDSGKTLSGSSFDGTQLEGLPLGSNCDLSYTQNTVGDRTYNNFSKISKSDKVFQQPQAKSVQQTFTPPAPRDELIDLAGARNNATELIAAIIATCETPEKAQEKLIELLNEQYWTNLTKTLFNEYKKIKEDVL